MGIMSKNEEVATCNSQQHNMRDAGAGRGHYMLWHGLERRRIAIANCDTANNIGVGHEFDNDNGYKSIVDAPEQHSTG